MFLDFLSNYVGLRFQTVNLSSLPVVSASFDGELKSYIPFDVRGRSVSDLYSISGFVVDVEYVGNLVQLGAIKTKRTWFASLPKQFIGTVKYSSKTNTTTVSYVYKVFGLGSDGPFFAEDVYHKASHFYSLMSCRAQGQEKE